MKKTEVNEQIRDTGRECDTSTMLTMAATTFLLSQHASFPEPSVIKIQFSVLHFFKTHVKD